MCTFEGELFTKVAFQANVASSSYFWRNERIPFGGVREMLIGPPAIFRIWNLYARVRVKLGSKCPVVKTCLPMQRAQDQSGLENKAPDCLGCDQKNLKKKKKSQNTWGEAFWRVRGDCSYCLPFSVVSNSLRPHGHTRLPCPSLSSGVLLKLMSVESVMPSLVSCLLVGWGRRN